jgi:hypothetical protein
MQLMQTRANAIVFFTETISCKVTLSVMIKSSQPPKKAHRTANEVRVSSAFVFKTHLTALPKFGTTNLCLKDQGTVALHRGSTNAQLGNQPEIRAFFKRQCKQPLLAQLITQAGLFFPLIKYENAYNPNYPF